MYLHLYIGLIHKSINITQSKKLSYLLKIGIASDVRGICSSTTNRNTEKDKRTVIPSETFSPDSAGSQNTSRSMIDRRMIGTNILMMLYWAFLFNSM